MSSINKAKLEQLGLSPAEAQIYLAVLEQGPVSVAVIAHETGIPRTSIYPIICSLADKGLVEGAAGYGSKFAAISPGQALPQLIAREKQTISERERIADELAEILAPLAADSEEALDDTVQILRTPHLISERCDRLVLEAEQRIEAFVKAPILSPQPSNPPQKKAQRRGVQIKALYEADVLRDEKVRPHLAGWIAAGEEARFYEGELPYKLVIFDRQVVLLTLVRRSGQPSAMFVRHAPFVRSLGILFDYFWEQGQTLSAAELDEMPAALAQPSRRATRKARQTNLTPPNNGRRPPSVKR